MKSRILLVVVVCALAVLLGLFMHHSAGTIAPTPAVAKVPAKAATATVSIPPTKTPEVAKPVLAAAPVNQNASSDKDSALIPADPQPQADLNAMLSQSIGLLQRHDMVGLFKTLTPPDQLEAMMRQMKVSTPDDLVQAIRANTQDLDKRANDLLESMEQIQGQTPVMSSDGNQATYQINVPAGYQVASPVGGTGSLTFVKVDGNWYLR